MARLVTEAAAMGNKYIGTNLNEVIKSQLKDPEFSREYEKQTMISSSVPNARDPKIKAPNNITGKAD